MKKIKLFNILLIIAMIFSMPIVYAHNISLAGDDIIPIPDKLNGTTKIEVAESFGKYKMYYQWVAMSDKDYADYMDFLQAQLDLPNPGANATNQEKQEYEEELLQYEASKTAVKPEYVDADWTESKDGTVPFNKELEGVEEGDPYVLWIKAVNEKDEEIFEERLVLYNADLVLEEDVENAETSDEILVVGLLSVAAMGVMAISYKKSKA